MHKSCVSKSDTAKSQNRFQFIIVIRVLYALHAAASREFDSSNSFDKPCQLHSAFFPLKLFRHEVFSQELFLLAPWRVDIKVGHTNKDLAPLPRASASCLALYIDLN